MLPEIDIIGQEKLANSKVSIIGLGGLGSPCSIYMAASGVGNLNLFDDDKVELSNLQRQIIFNSSDLGEEKSSVARDKLSEQSMTQSEPSRRLLILFSFTLSV